MADENYIRESILNPAVKVVAGFKPIMPTYQGQVSEETLAELVSYIKSLSQPHGGRNSQPKKLAETGNRE